MKTVFELIEEHGLTLHGDIEHFAELVAAAENEACEKVIESHGPSLANGAMLAEAIRARRNT